MATWDELLGRAVGMEGQDVDAVSVVFHDGEYRIGLVTLEGVEAVIAAESDGRRARVAVVALAAMFRVTVIRVYRNIPCGTGCIRQLEAVGSPRDLR